MAGETNFPGLYQLRKRVLELTYKNKLSHLSATLSALPILREMFSSKGRDDAVVLSQGHAGLALYVLLEWYLGLDAQMLLDVHGVHPHREVSHGIHVSSGSLGMGITVALGMAMSGRKVFCLISDGECAEGSVWEALKLARDYPNLIVYVNDNGQTALSLRKDNLSERILAFLPSARIRTSKGVGLPFTSGVESHYHVIKESEYAFYAE